MLKLVAIDAREGWAFVKESDGLVLIRPPYEHQDKRSASAAILARAVQEGDFEPNEKEFVGWGSLVEFVRSQVIDYAKRAGRVLDAPVGDELIAVAPLLLIEELLEQVESELFPANEWVVAETLLDSILFRSRLMNTDPELNKRVRELLSVVKENQKAFKERRENKLRDDSGYKRLKRRGELDRSHKIGQSIHNQGTMFP